MKKILKLLCVSILTLSICAITTTEATASNQGKTGLDVDTISGVAIQKSIIPYTPQRRPGIRINPEYITIHNTGNRDYGADADMHQRLLSYTTSSETSWHYTVDDIKIIQHLPLNEMGYHAGDNGGQGNFKSIGIEICENADGYYPKSEENGWKLAARLLYEYDLDISCLVTHNSWSGKECPYNLLNTTYGSVGWEQFKKNVSYELERLTLENKSSIVSRREAIEMSVNETRSLGISYRKGISYDVAKDSQYQMHSNETSSSAKWGVYDSTKEKIEYVLTGTLLSNTTKKEGTLSEVMNAMTKKKLKTSHNYLLSINENNVVLEREGSDIIEITSEEGEIKAVIQVYVAGAPELVSDKDVFLELNSLNMFSTKANKLGNWHSSNDSIVSVKNGEIIALQPGEVTISVDVNSIVLSKKIVVK